VPPHAAPPSRHDLPPTAAKPALPAGFAGSTLTDDRVTPEVATRSGIPTLELAEVPIAAAARVVPAALPLQHTVDAVGLQDGDPMDALENRISSRRQILQLSE
jgi:hypothetical protein